MSPELRNALYRQYAKPAFQVPLRFALHLMGRDRSRIKKYLRTNTVRRLQIGAGQNLRPGWLNTNWYPIGPRLTEAIFLDATRRFPLPDASFDLVYSEHVFEHLAPGGGMVMLREIMRVLKPGGILRISTPKLEFLIALLGENPTAIEREYIAWTGRTFLQEGWPHTRAGVVNNYVRDWGHQFIYDRETLRGQLAAAGFDSITECAVGESTTPDLHNLENVGRMPDGFLALETMTFEARKGASN